MLREVTEEELLAMANDLQESEEEIPEVSTPPVEPQARVLYPDTALPDIPVGDSTLPADIVIISVKKPEEELSAQEINWRLNRLVKTRGLRRFEPDVYWTKTHYFIRTIK